MKVTQKKKEGDKVFLTATATAKEVDVALQSAQFAFAQSMGLQPEHGKTVAQIAEERLGIKNLDSVVEVSAIEDLVPLALDKKNVVPLFPPKPVTKTVLKRGREFQFDLEVTLKPEYELKSYDPVEITVQPFVMDESLVDKQIGEMAENYTTYVSAEDKTVEKGDSCLIALSASENGVEIKGLTTDGRTYTTGAGLMPDGFDEAIIGMKPGETKTFSFEGPNMDDQGNPTTQVVDCTVTVKEIQNPVLPTIDDEWVKANLPMFDTLEAFRAKVRGDIERQMRAQYEDYRLGMASSALVQRFEGRIADEAYEAMRNIMRGQLHASVQQQGMTWDDFVQQNGGEQQVSMMMMMQTREVLIRGFALDAVFRHENMVLTDEDIEATCKAMNPRVDPKQTRRQYEQSGRGFVLREAAERRKANQWVLDHAIVKEEGEPVPLS